MLNRFMLMCCLLLAAMNAWSQTQAVQWESEGDTLATHEDWAGALKLYNKVIEAAGTDVKSVVPVYYKRAVCLYSLGEMSSAFKDVNIFLTENPDNLRALLLRAFALKELGQREEQLADLNHAVSLQPGNPDILKWRSTVYLEKSQFALAATDLIAARKIADDPETEMYLAMAYYGEGHTDSALLCLNKAIEMDVTQITPYLYAASYCLQEEQYDLALKYANVALKIQPQNPDAFLYKGIALVELKREKEGCRSLTKALSAGQEEAVGYLKEYCYGIED